MSIERNGELVLIAIRCDSMYAAMALYDEATSSAREGELCLRVTTKEAARG